MVYNIGVGKCDVTGPCAEVGFMGMSNPCQTGKGIHMRLFSRAFVVGNPGDGKHVAIVCADVGICSIAVKRAVVRRLAEQGPFKEAGQPVYGEENVMICATHTHSGPGGYSHYLTYNASIRGFNEQNFDVVVTGIVKSIQQAHQNKGPGRILTAEGDLANCGKIRSLPAYARNPEIDENEINDPGSVEPIYRKMTLLKFVAADGREKGTINWFALHPINLGEKNKLISGDNKGYAEYLFEKAGGVVSAFANSCCGDVSANVGYGVPDGKHDLGRAKEFAERQFRFALDLYEAASEELAGDVDYRYNYVDMSHCILDGTAKRTWPAAMGLGMVNGSQEDSRGLGLKSWGEGTTKYNVESNPKLFNKLVKIGTEIFGIDWPQSYPPEYEEGHGAKAIFLPLGYMTYNGLPIAPPMLPLQIIKLGSVLLVAHPGEMTTVAGMRLRDTVGKVLGIDQGIRHIVVATYANGFASYTTTAEEYEAQHYEGASTLFGPWTLPAFQQENERLAAALRDRADVVNGGQPEELPVEEIKKVKSVWVRPDSALSNLDYGEFDETPNSSYRKGETVRFGFVAGHPNRDLRSGGTYFVIEREVNGSWERVFTDNDFNTQLHWHMRSQASVIRVEWEITDRVVPGTYRIVYKGPVKFRVGDAVQTIHVESRPFTVS